MTMIGDGGDDIMGMVWQACRKERKRKERGGEDEILRK